VRYEFGILFSFHSFECPFLFRTLISSVASIFPMKVTEQFLRDLRRSAASASSFPSAPVGPAPLMVFFGVVVVLLLRGLCGWWDYVRIEFFWLIHILRRFIRCLFDCFVASSTVASLTFFVRPFACGLLRTLRISLPPHTILTDFLVALCRGGMPIGLGGDLR